MAAVNHPTKLFSLKIGHLRAPTLSVHAAVRDAERSMPSVGPANGVSLVRTTKNSDPSHPGTVVWMVSIDIRHALLWHGPGPGHHVRHRQRANYLVVAGDPYSGKFEIADGGYDPRLTQRS